MPVLKEESVIKINVRMAIIIIGIIFAIFSTLFTYQELRISKLERMIEDKGTEIYLIRTENLPNLEKKDVILETQQFMILKLIDGDLIIRPTSSSEYMPEPPH